MDINSFKESLTNNTPPAGIRAELKALWFEAKGDWNKAHRIVQNLDSSEAAWVHAYLHRKEGSINNADYWYSRAGRAMSGVSLDEEWQTIAEAFLTL